MTVDPDREAPDRLRRESGPAAVNIANLGLCPYLRVLELQRFLREAVLDGRQPETLILTEHPAVVTLGRAADPANLVASRELLEASGVEMCRVERGGDVTYHGPGQLVAYPVFRVDRGIKTFVRALAESARAVCADLGIQARWEENRPGVWVGDAKIAALGIHVHRAVSIHGLALNVSVDLSGFALIVPCGLAGARVTSMTAVLGREVAPAEVAPRLTAHLLELTRRIPGTFFQGHEIFSYLDTPVRGA